MSNFEDYDAVSKSYDDQRFATGADVIAAMMQFHCRKPLKDIHILDAGCGTGNYAKALLDYGVGSVTLLDASAGMLEKAKIKLADAIASGQVKEVVHTSMPPLPFPDSSFDAVMFNMVLHHLEANPDGVHFPTIEQVLKESRRVLVLELAITSFLPSVFLPRIWFTRLNEDIGERPSKLYPESRQWLELFKLNRFHCLAQMDIKADIPENIAIDL